MHRVEMLSSNLVSTRPVHTGNLLKTNEAAITSHEIRQPINAAQTEMHLHNRAALSADWPHVSADALMQIDDVGVIVLQEDCS